MIYKSKIMNAREVLINKITGDYNIYSNVMVNKMEFPAVILTPSTQVFKGNLGSYKNYNTDYEWTLIIIFKIDDFDDDKMTSAMDAAWLLAETIPDMMGVKILESVPFGHYKDNKELFCIEFKVISAIK